MADACNRKMNTEDASDEGGTCPPKLVVPHDKEEIPQMEDMDDPTNGIFAQRDPRDNLMAPNQSYQNAQVPLPPMTKTASTC